MKIKLDPDNACWFYDFMLVKIEKHFAVKETRMVDYGCQIRLECGAVVNVFYTLKFGIGGVNYGKKLVALIPELIKDFLWCYTTDKRNEEMLKKMFQEK